MKCNKIAICDDNTSIQNKLKNSIIKLFPDFEDKIYTFSNEVELSSFVSNNIGAHILILLDIKLKDANGITEAINLKNRYNNISIIFITGYTDYLSDIFDAKPVGLLYKPFDDEHLQKAINSGIIDLEKTDESRIPIHVVNEGTLLISYNDILYIESHKRLLNIHTLDRMYSTYMKMDSIIEMLPESFIYCHKSYLVNSKMIKSYARSSFTLINEANIPISRSNIERARSLFFDNLRVMDSN